MSTPPTTSQSAQPDTDQWIGLGLAALGAALFATKGIFVKLGLAHGLDPLTLLAWRMILAVPVFAFVGVKSYRRRRTGYGRHAGQPIAWRAVCGAAAIGILSYYGASFLDFLSLDRITAQLNRLVLLTYPFMVLILGAVLFGRRLPFGALASALLAYVGIATIFAHDLAIEGGAVLTGTLLALASALAYALYQVFAKPLIDHLGPGLFTAIAMSAAGIVIIASFLLSRPLADLAIAGPTLAILLGLAFAATVAPAFATSMAIGLVGSERTAVFGNISPLVTILLAIAILGEPFTLWHGIGTALVICGIILFTRLTRQSHTSAKAAQ